jgi:hypothetical protein
MTRLCDFEKNPKISKVFVSKNQLKILAEFFSDF